MSRSPVLIANDAAADSGVLRSARLGEQPHRDGTDIVVDGGAIGGRRFSEVMAVRQATRSLFD